MPNTQSNPFTAVWYFVAGTFLCAASVFILTSGSTSTAVAAIPLLLGALLLVVGAVVAVREARQRASRD